LPQISGAFFCTVFLAELFVLLAITLFATAAPKAGLPQAQELLVLLLKNIWHDLHYSLYDLQLSLSLSL